jgi:UDP-N-acetylmuramoyl-L-alanyl-D-glutamate--2,6-diaminopimelate ligase
MQLNDLLQAIEPIQIIGTTNYLVEKIVFDSRLAVESSLFVAVAGTTVDGHSFIPSVIEKGCKMIVSEKVCQVPDSVTLIVVNDTSISLALLASQFYGNPSNKLTLVGVTGTNGKTTIATLLHALFGKLGYHVGLLSTVVNKIGSNEIHSTHTTPDPVALNHLLSEMVENGCTHCFMEVSSHSIIQHRITGLSFNGGIFTNITHDHLDYHGSFKEYIKAKKLFFDGLPSAAFSLSNLDDKNGLVMLQNTKARKITYSLKSVSDFKTKIIENQISGLVLSIDGTEVWTKLIGEFNAYNLLAVYATAILLGEDKLEVLTALSNLHAVVGRFQQIRSNNGIIAIVDYAHTPDALENVLDTIASIRTKNENVITVVGCGGDRDKDKRPKMAAVACEKSNKVILTSDNPRSENPDTIINEMMSGVEGQFFKNTLAITDRSQAIKTACSIANSGDIILIAGKGHESYQEIMGVKHPFDDLKLITELFEKMEK